MNTADFFKKLCVGVNFNVSKFRPDAERFKLVKKTEDHGSKPQERPSHSPGDQANGLGAPKSAVKRKKPGSTGGIDDNETTSNQANSARACKRQRIRAKGTDVPELLSSFEELAARYKLSQTLLRNIASLGYQEPTAVQRQAIPAMLERRELLCCAPTGSGKTAAFLVPIIGQLQRQQSGGAKSSKAKGGKAKGDKAKEDSGFRALVLSPTRELARQTYRECLQLVRDTGLKVYLLSKLASARTRLASAQHKLDILVCTPNRLLCLIRSGILELNRVEWLVLDESDKLFEAAGGARGFREQLARVCKACSGSPRLRRALFSATATRQVEDWCRLHLDALLTLTVGIRNAAADLVDQELYFVGSESGKLPALRALVKKGQFQPPVLVFVQSKQRAKELFAELVYDGINVDAIHSERPQVQRDRVVQGFRAGHIWVLICTELLARGLDFQGVGLVLNYDLPPSAVSYVHRVGRTGRAGHRGRAITFFTEDDVSEGRLRSIVQLLRESGQPLPDYLLGSKPKRRQRQNQQMVAQRDPISDASLDKKKKRMRAKRVPGKQTVPP